MINVLVSYVSFKFLHHIIWQVFFFSNLLLGVQSTIDGSAAILLHLLLSTIASLYHVLPYLLAALLYHFSLGLPIFLDFSAFPCRMSLVNATIWLLASSTHLILLLLAICHVMQWEKMAEYNNDDTCIFRLMLCRCMIPVFCSIFWFAYECYNMIGIVTNSVELF